MRSLALTWGEAIVVNRNAAAMAAISVLVLLYSGTAIQGQQAPKKWQAPTFRVGVETVFVKVSVSDPLNRFVTGLEKDNFKIYEDKVQQTIDYFTQEPAPVSVGIVFDVSGSMKDNNNIQKAKNAIVRFLETGNPEDEYALITFNERTSLVQNFTHQSSTVRSEIALKQAGGRTAVYDAVYMGLDQIKAGKNEKKALILITDGEDNSSRYSISEVREFAKESDVQIYAVGEQGMLGYGRSLIQGIVSLTGGRAFFPNNFNELDYYIDLIHAELRNQYVLGYSPSNKVHDGKWRKIQVKLDPPPGLPKLSVHAKEGYNAPKN
ncbi:MAG: VWA domain-containing protein [Acidobacteriia bacterium]|nr:VWA domain-containing protein [Terriglobia bacterium]